jgi:hypothetical protein
MAEPGMGVESGLVLSGRERRPFPGDLGVTLYNEAPSPAEIFDEGDGLHQQFARPNCFSRWQM